MIQNEGHAEEARRDLSAARTELRGRRDKVVADFDDRLGLLDNLATALDSGDLTPKAVQHRVRQLLGGRGTLQRSARAGRTSIGMQVPQTAAAAPAVSARSAPTSKRILSNLARVRAAVDSRIVRIMLHGNRAEARLELALLRGLRRALEQQAAALPEDVVLLDSVAEFADGVETTLQDLDSGGSRRLRRLLEYDRELVSQVVALGGSVTGVKDQIKRARGLLSRNDPNLQAATREAASAFARLQQELQRCAPAENKSFFDDLVVGSTFR